MDVNHETSIRNAIPDGWNKINNRRRRNRLCTVGQSLCLENEFSRRTQILTVSPIRRRKIRLAIATARTWNPLKRLVGNRNILRAGYRIRYCFTAVFVLVISTARRRRRRRRLRPFVSRRDWFSTTHFTENTVNENGRHSASTLAFTCAVLPKLERRPSAIKAPSHCYLFRL